MATSEGEGKGDYMADENKQNGGVISGRKVFFLNPSYTIQNDILKALWGENYEVYVISDYRYAKNIIRHNPNSMLFVNIDISLSIMGWFMFIDSFRYDDILKTTIIGIITDRMSQADQDLFLTRSEIKGGFFTTKDSIPNLIESFRNVLDMYNVKGRRQYVRAMCLQEKDSTVLWQHGGKLFQFKMADISIVSAAVVLPAEFKKFFKPGMILEHILMKMGTLSFEVDLQIYAIHDRGESALMITMFTGEAYTASVKKTIMDYVYKTLNNQIGYSISGEKSDTTDYIQLGRRFQEEQKQELEYQRKQQALEERKAERAAQEAKMKVKV